jgi:hypothetical protein
MEIDEEKVDEAVLALLYLTTFKDKPNWRAWKSHNWDSLDRLHQKGYISDPATKAKSVLLTEEVRSGRKICLRNTSQNSGRIYSEPRGFVRNPFPTAPESVRRVLSAIDRHLSVQTGTILGRSADRRGAL